MKIDKLNNLDSSIIVQNEKSFYYYFLIDDNIICFRVLNNGLVHSYKINDMLFHKLDKYIVDLVRSYSFDKEIRDVYFNELGFNNSSNIIIGNKALAISYVGSIIFLTKYNTTTGLVDNIEVNGINLGKLSNDKINLIKKMNYVSNILCLRKK